MLIEAFVIGELSALLDVPVYAEDPEDRPARYVTVEKTGAEEERRVRRATLAVQSNAESLLAAAELNERVREAMERLWDCDEIASCRLETDYNWTDTSRRGYRYQGVYHLTYY